MSDPIDNSEIGGKTDLSRSNQNKKVLANAGGASAHLGEYSKSQNLKSFVDAVRNNMKFNNILRVATLCKRHSKGLAISI